MNDPEYKSRVPRGGPSGASSQDTSSASSSREASVKRVRRTISLNVDYNLKKRRIIPAEDEKTQPERRATSNTAEASFSDPQPPQRVIQRDSNGEIEFHEPPPAEPVNGMTGLPLSMGPPEKTKKESLWSYKKGSSTPASATGSEETYRERLETPNSEQLTRLSSLRSITKPKDIYRTKRQYRKKNNHIPPKQKHFPIHTKIKASTAKENKLFGQNSTTNQKAIPPPIVSSTEATVENDDFCSSCRQPGIFLCCDTCPRSFHFACCNPPLDPDNLPEGDWSCAECQFKIRCPNKAAANKLEAEYTAELQASKNITLFGKLLFRLEFTNPKQYLLPHQIRDAFVDVKTGPHGEYSDNSMREPLNEKQVFGSGYGQSLTKMDQYNPELHIDQDSGKLLVCFKCRSSKMGTVDHPEDERLITKCGYCNTAWHLDCVPDVPRASFKNLGSKWMCPLHADSSIPHRERRLARHQRIYAPSVPLNVSNNGDIDIELEEISAPMSNDTIKEAKINKETAVLKLPERSIKLDFVDKIYRAKSALMDKQFHQQETLLDKAIQSIPKDSTTLSEVQALLYFSLQGNQQLQKLWDFKELCNLANKELELSQISSEEVSELLTLRKLLESKPKGHVLEFFGMNQ